MINNAILFPMFALVAWTGIVLALIPIARFGAARNGQVVADDFKFGESASVPQAVSIPNRNYMNLLELPMLFYVVCALLYVSNAYSSTAVDVAWAYVTARVLHSGIHLTYNKVMHRLVLFTISNGLLIALWVMAGLRLLSPG